MDVCVLVMYLHVWPGTNYEPSTIKIPVLQITLSPGLPRLLLVASDFKSEAAIKSLGTRLLQISNLITESGIMCWGVRDACAFQ